MDLKLYRAFFFVFALFFSCQIMQAMDTPASTTVVARDLSTEFLKTRLHTLENQDIPVVIMSGDGKFFIYQNTDDVAPPSVTITSKSNELNDVRMRIAGDGGLLIGPRPDRSGTQFECYLKLKKMPELVLRNNVMVRLESPIADQHCLVFVVRDNACLTASPQSSIKTSALNIGVSEAGRLDGLSGVAPIQSITVKNSGYCQSFVKSNQVLLDMDHQGSAELDLSRRFRHFSLYAPCEITGAMSKISRLQYAGDVEFKNLRYSCNSSIEKITL